MKQPEKEKKYFKDFIPKFDCKECSNYHTHPVAKGDNSVKEKSKILSSSKKEVD